MLDFRFRDVHRFARAGGYVSGFSTLEEGLVDLSNGGQYLEYQAVLIPSGSGTVPSVNADDLGNPEFSNIEQMFRSAHRYAREQNYTTGFPAFEQGRNQNGELVFGITLLNSEVVDIRSVPASCLGTPSFSDTTAMFNSVHRYSRDLNSGYISGYPLFEQGLENGVLKYGVALVKSSATFLQHPADLLALYGRGEPNQGTLVLITDNGTTQAGGVVITNESGGPAAVVAGTVILNFPPGSEVSIEQINRAKPVGVSTYEIRSNMIPSQTGQIQLSSGDASTERYVLSAGGEIITKP